MNGQRGTGQKGHHFVGIDKPDQVDSIVVFAVCCRLEQREDVIGASLGHESQMDSGQPAHSLDQSVHAASSVDSTRIDNQRGVLCEPDDLANREGVVLVGSNNRDIQDQVGGPVQAVVIDEKLGEGRRYGDDPVG